MRVPLYTLGHKPVHQGSNILNGCDLDACNLMSHAQPALRGGQWPRLLCLQSQLTFSEGVAVYVSSQVTYSIHGTGPDVSRCYKWKVLAMLVVHHSLCSFSTMMKIFQLPSRLISGLPSRFSITSFAAWVG